MWVALCHCCFVITLVLSLCPVSMGRCPRSVSQSVFLDEFYSNGSSSKNGVAPLIRETLKNKTKQALGMSTQISSVLEKEAQCPAVEEVSGSLSVMLLCPAWGTQDGYTSCPLLSVTEGANKFMKPPGWMWRCTSITQHPGCRGRRIMGVKPP